MKKESIKDITRLFICFLFGWVWTDFTRWLILDVIKPPTENDVFNAASTSVIVGIIIVLLSANLYSKLSKKDGK